MKVIGYARVSTIGQAKDGLGIPTQQRLLRSWAKANGHRLVRIVDENGKSGTLPETDRPGLLEALTAVHRGEVQALVVTSLDRLARALTVQEALLLQVWTADGRVFTVDCGEVPQDDPDDPMRTAMRQIAGVFSELDRKLVVKRLRNGRATKAARGGHAVGAAPYGQRAKDGELVPDSDEQAVLMRIMHERQAGASFAQIARGLNDDDIAARRGAWHPTTVSRALARIEHETIKSIKRLGHPDSPA